MSEPQEIVPTTREELVGAVARFLAEGHRLVQIGCTTLPSGYELNYSFDKANRFTNLRLSVAPGEEVPSVSVVYPNAFLYENEIHDLFGVEIRNIVLDYGGTLYQTTLKVPFSVGNVKFPERPKPKGEGAGQKPEKAKQQVDGPATE